MTLKELNTNQCNQIEVLENDYKHRHPSESEICLLMGKIEKNKLWQPKSIIKGAWENIFIGNFLITTHFKTPQKHKMKV